MIGNDITQHQFAPRLRDVATAIGLLTRFPLPSNVFVANDPRPAAHAAWAYPLVGLVVGILSVCAAWIATSIGLPTGIVALFAVLSSILITGAMHEDGLADCADGFWGGWTRERRLEIMKDSQVGTYGVIALVCALALRWLAIAALLNAGGAWAALLGASVVSRAVMVGLMYALPHARSTGLSHQTGKPPLAATLGALAIGGIALLFVVPAPFFSAIFAVGLLTLLFGLIAKAKIAGQTGDVLGATQQIVEITVLLCCLVALP